MRRTKTIMNQSGQKSSFKISELTKAAMFIALMAISANLTAFITVGTVPLTFQTVVAILAGILLGKKLGTFSMVGYTVIGLLGVPVFAGLKGGMHVITTSTFGFILSFIVLAFVAGLIVEKAKRPTLLTYFIASFAGLLINYGIGVPYVYFYTHFVLELTEVTFTAISVGMGPFFVKDAILAGFAAVLCPKILKAVNASSRQMNNSHPSAS